MRLGYVRGLACTVAAMCLAEFGAPAPALGQCELAQGAGTDTTAGGAFGQAVTVSGTYSVVGAPFDAGLGSASVYHWDGGGWVQQAKLSAGEAAAGDQFGLSVTNGGDWIAVGAPGHEGGAVYMFRRDGLDWIEHVKLTAEDPVDSTRFGEQVEISGNYVAAGAPLQDDGAVYLFRRDDSGTPADPSDDVWLSEATLTAANAVQGERFGSSVSMSGGVVVAGAPLRPGGGAVYVFRNDGVAWAQEAILSAVNPAVAFGTSVSVSGDAVVVGALFQGAQGAVGPAAYVYEYGGSSWGWRAYHELGRADDLTGGTVVSVAIEGETALIGTPAEEFGQAFTGTVTVLDRRGGLWERWGVMSGSAAMDLDKYGWSVALGDGFAVVGAPKDDDGGKDTGSAYLLWGATQPDCNDNNVGDFCDIRDGTVPDEDANGVPDPCETCLPDDDCDDGLWCNGLEFCNAAIDRCRSGPEPCPDPEFPYCDEANQECDQCITGGECDDLLFCNGVEACDADGFCTPGTSPCTADQICDEINDECDNCDEAADCDDGVFCNGAETCDSNGVCQPGTSPCPPELVCDEDNKECDNCDEDGDCNDGRFCTGVETCDPDGNCQPGKSPCRVGLVCDEEHDECDQCDEDSDCVDGSFCNGVESCGTDGLCRPGTSPCPSDLVCNELSDECEQCGHDGDCVDGDMCTVDTCVEGACVHTPAAICDDWDQDAVPNELDACPGTASGSSVDAEGCACTQLDADGDGVTNCTDQCSGTAPGLTVDPVGCPTGPRPGAAPLPDGDVDTGSGQVGAEPGPEEVTAPGDGPADNGVAPDPLPGGEDTPGASTPDDQVHDSGTGSARASRRSGSTCGLLGMTSLLTLLSGAALLRRTRRA